MLPLVMFSLTTDPETMEPGFQGLKHLQFKCFGTMRQWKSLLLTLIFSGFLSEHWQED
jgi:hypothetical protein